MEQSIEILHNKNRLMMGGKSKPKPRQKKRHKDQQCNDSKEKDANNGSSGKPKGKGGKKKRKTLNEVNGVTREVTQSTQSSRITAAEEESSEEEEICSELERVKRENEDLKKRYAQLQNEHVSTTEQRRSAVQTLTLTSLAKYTLNAAVKNLWFTNNKFTTRKTLAKDTRFLVAFMRECNIPAGDESKYKDAVIGVVLDKVSQLRADVRKKIRKGYESEYDMMQCG